MFIYNLYKPLNVALGSNDDQTVFYMTACWVSVFFLPSFLRNFFDRQYSFTCHLRRVAVNALV